MAKNDGIGHWIAAVGIALCLVIPMHGSSQCTREDAMKAETEASSLKTWHEVFESYKRYQSCDDGAIAEGYSASIAELFANHWDRLGELSAITRKNPKFQAFVVRHLDQTMTSSQDTAIKRNVQSRCPENARRLCKLISERLKELDRESAPTSSHE